MEYQSILKEGGNCWKISNANNISLLVDGEEYFSTLVEVIQQAEKQVYIAGWDIDSRFLLVRKENDNLSENSLSHFLNRVALKKHDLQIYILIWDFAVLYALEREWLPAYKLNWKTPSNIHFIADDQHPLGASHHQKFVVVDDTITFVGGFDLSKWRWDTRAHNAKDKRRIDPNSYPYPPFHDIQMMMDGDAAIAMGDLFRDRWFRATQERLSDTESLNPQQLWPPSRQPDIVKTKVGIARTYPTFKGNPEVREVEQLYIDSLLSAKRFIYIENQYVTANILENILAKMLAKENGPEIVIVTHPESGGWLEHHTMDVLRYRLLLKLCKADRFNRLRVYYPFIPGLGDKNMTVHSKLCIVDDTILRLGSSNLANRSMGIDSECDIVVEGDNPAIKQFIEDFRNQLIAEHLGVDHRVFTNCFNEKQSIITAIEELQGGGRTLRKLDPFVPEFYERQIPDSAVIDPEQPMKPKWLLEQLLPKKDHFPISQGILRFSLVILFVITLAVAWRWTPIKEIITFDEIRHWMQIYQNNGFGLVAVIAAFVIGALLAVPITIMVSMTAIFFSPATAFFYSLTGTLLSAIVTFYIGSYFGAPLIQNLTESKINRISKRLSKRGVVNMILIRLVPIAPFTLINIVAGASHIKIVDFIIGTLLGSVPGTFFVTLFVSQLAAAALSPDSRMFYMLAVFGMVVVVSGWYFKNKLSNLRERFFERKVKR